MRCQKQGFNLRFIGSNRVSEIRVNKNRVRIWARVMKFRVRNFRVRVRLSLRAKMCFNVKILHLLKMEN